MSSIGKSTHIHTHTHTHTHEQAHTNILVIARGWVEKEQKVTANANSFFGGLMKCSDIRQL